ncbi:MAG TPA: NADH-quinone oxidoreductase subunit NuoG [Solirubrobacteraceae bacterium]|nr:NADH-quinone oxidoreductase subunit NuoG [Solirubrobacteraceae bacterium]
MPRPEQKTIQLTIDGREVEAIENTMLVDAAKHGDVEIPYFCYEPKLGNPVGACRMCLVEIEGIPKLQTSCSTPVKDGMVVHTQTDRVKHAQNAVVEFLLINHPLDCPVCDKGGECPLQDITFGWGLGRSRMIEPKRHFEKPLALSPLVAIDRERCILCYRCVRFSQEIAEDYQLIFTERGAHTFVGTHDGHPYVAPFSGNIVELCPVGALTSQPYRFRARPWDIEQGAGICTLCPSQCNVTFTVRDERVMRVLARDYIGNEGVDDGWLCDKGRFAYQAIHVDERITRPLIRDAGVLRETSWERAFEAAQAIAKHRGRIGALVGGQVTNEEGFLLQRLLRDGLDSHDIDSRQTPHGTPIGSKLAKALAAPALQASVQDIEFAHTVLLLDTDLRDDAPILDLRVRKGVRRHDVKLLVASARPTALDPNATVVARYAPGADEELLDALHRGLDGEQGLGQTIDELVAQLRDGGDDVVIIFGERIGATAAASMLRLARRLGLDHPGAGLLQIPSGANGRGLREVGSVPDALPGYAPAAHSGRATAQIGRALVDGELTALYLMQADPIRDEPDRALWERAMHAAPVIVAHASVLTEGLKEHATVVFPAESHAEKDGTVTHPDGRLQRLRIAIAHPGEVRPGWEVLSELARRCGTELGVDTAREAFAQLAAAVPQYAGLERDEIPAHGVRWPELDGAGAAWDRDDDAAVDDNDGEPRFERPRPTDEQLAIGTYRSIWAAPEVEISPTMQYLVARQLVELSPQDADRYAIADGEEIVVRQNGTLLNGTAHVRTGVPDGSAFLAAGIASDSANVLTEPLVSVQSARAYREEQERLAREAEEAEAAAREAEEAALAAERATHVPDTEEGQP